MLEEVIETNLFHLYSLKTQIIHSSIGSTSNNTSTFLFLNWSIYGLAFASDKLFAVI